MRPKLKIYNYQNKQNGSFFTKFNFKFKFGDISHVYLLILKSLVCLPAPMFSIHFLNIINTTAAMQRHPAQPWQGNSQNGEARGLTELQRSRAGVNRITAKKSRC